MTALIRSTARSHALMAALYAAADRADLMTLEVFRLMERVLEGAWRVSA